MEKELSLTELFLIVRRNLLLVSCLALIGGAIGYGSAVKLPKKFKSKSVISVQSSYFKNPLVSEIVTETHDVAEIRAQRESLIQLALNTSFLDQLGNDFGYYADASFPVQIQRELLRERIEFFSLSATNFQISVIDSDPKRAYTVLEQIVDRVQSTFSEQRLSKLEGARDAIENTLNNVKDALAQKETLRKEKDVRQLRLDLERVESDLSALLQSFTRAHPKVRKLLSKRDALSKDIDSLYPKEQVDTTNSSGAFLALGEKEDLEVLHSKLLSQLSNLSLVLEIEREEGVLTYVNIIEAPVLPARPFFPVKRNFAFYGLLFGLFLGASIAAIREIHRGTLLEPEAASKEWLGIELLGEFPDRKDPNLLKLPKQRLPLPPGARLLSWKPEEGNGSHGL